MSKKIVKKTYSMRLNPKEIDRIREYLSLRGMNFTEYVEMLIRESDLYKKLFKE